MVGTPWAPVPGKQPMNVPTAITEEGEAIGDEVEDRTANPSGHEEDEVDGDVPRVTPHNMHVSRKAISKIWNNRRLSRM